MEKDEAKKIKPLTFTESKWFTLGSGDHSYCFHTIIKPSRLAKLKEVEEFLRTFTVRVESLFPDAMLNISIKYTTLDMAYSGGFCSVKKGYNIEVPGENKLNALVERVYISIDIFTGEIFNSA